MRKINDEYYTDEYADFLEQLDYLVQHTEGHVNKYIHTLIKKYHELEHDYEDLESKYEDLKEDYGSYRDNSRPLTQSEMAGVPQFGPID